MIDTARAFALEKHGNQKYGSKPYSYHLDAVAGLLEPQGETAQVIGYLHDVVEDTGGTLEEIESRFGKHVADAVAILTDQPGETRAEKKKATYELMSKVEGELEIALIVKTADRLANVLACVEFDRPDKLEMYQGEHGTFRAAVFRPGLCDDLWAQLSELLG